jgi:hypothetical protein
VSWVYVRLGNTLNVTTQAYLNCGPEGKRRYESGTNDLGIGGLSDWWHGNFTISISVTDPPPLCWVVFTGRNAPKWSER